MPYELWCRYIFYATCVKLFKHAICEKSRLDLDNRKSEEF